MARTLRIVNYAVNGSGVGHLTRLIAINRWMRRYALHAGVRAEIYFLTSCEADGLLFGERFASFKLPSKTTIGDAGVDKLTYLALAKQWVWHSLGLLRPDLLVVDSFPRGSFGELLSALDLARHRAFIYRPVKAAFGARADFQTMLPLYDTLVVPEHRSTVEVEVPAAVHSRVHYVGPVMVRERVELMARAAARAELGVPEGRLAVYVTAGGGGDGGAEQQLATSVRALLELPDVHVVVGAGPLYRGRALHGERVTWLTRGGAAELHGGLDLAVSAAGYNSWSELMHAGVPTVFLQQEKIADEQHVRAARAAAAGAAVVLEPGPGLPAALRAAVEGWRDPAAREVAAAAARALLPRNHAREAAAELLRLIMPASEVAAAEAAIDDQVLAAARSQGVALETLIDVMHALAPPDGDGEGAGGGNGRKRRVDRGSESTSRLACELMAAVSARGIPVPAALRVITQASRKLPLAAPAERAAAVTELLGELAAFDDWAGAATLLKLLTPEKQLSASGLTRELASFLGGLRARGEDLYRGVAYLSSAQGSAGELPSNGALLAAAMAAPTRAS